ncbi:methylmalonyl-CoA mutase [Vulgatibacter sp.]|uniref:acyl-CoA mutase large subunit family protein n=1 Tax=Vulgatibacter sp. TaxID=1971226 RepID=UPI0035633506
MSDRGADERELSTGEAPARDEGAIRAPRPATSARVRHAPRYETRSGIPLQPFYGPEDVRSEAAPPPGQFPFTRGIFPDMYRGKVWTMRQYAGFGTPEETNERFRFLLEAGQTGLSLALDLPTQLGLDSDDPMAAGEVGKVGVAIDSLADMETVFAQIPLDRVSTSMTINATAAILLAMYEAVARQQGVAPERISGTVQNDLLKEFGARGAWVFPIEPSMRLALDVIEDTVQRLPRFNPISIASHYRDAGANPAEEMAYTLAAGMAYVRGLLDRGLDPDAFGKRLSFFFYTYVNFFEEVAKYRAGRRIWARFMKEVGAGENAQRLRAACVCGGQSLTRAEPLNNVARITLEAFAVTCAGLQSVFTAAYDEAFAIPTELSARTSLRVQQILEKETEVAKVADPLGGSYFVEALTDQMEGAIRAVLDRIDAQGGMEKALETGWLQMQIGRRAYEWQRGVDSGEIPVVGVNVHRSEAEEQAIEQQALSTEAQERQRSSLARVRGARDPAQVRQALRRVEETARSRENLMPSIREAVLAYATVGEITQSIKQVFGEYQPPSRF